MKTTMRTYRLHHELKAAAESMTDTIVIRSYHDGSSEDRRRKPTARERSSLHGILYSALLALNESESARSDTDVERAIISNAEYTMIVLRDTLCRSPETREDPGAHVNTYDSIYCPLMDYIRAWRAESEQI